MKMRYQNIYGEEIDEVSVKGFTGRYSCLTSYSKTVLES